jgi:hypothetical protein
MPSTLVAGKCCDVHLAEYFVISGSDTSYMERSPLILSNLFMKLLAFCGARIFIAV